MGENAAITHRAPDCDACLSGAILEVEPNNKHFVPANLTIIPNPCVCCGRRLSGNEIIVDHPPGDKGRRDPDGTVHSASALLVEERKMLNLVDPRLIEEIEELDTTGTIENPRFSLKDLMAAVRIFESVNRGRIGVEHDRAAYATMSALFRGINLLYQQRVRAHDLIKEIEIEIVKDFQVAILPRGTLFEEIGVILSEERDVSVGIYHDDSGLYARRYPGRMDPDFRRLEKHLSNFPGWFVHSDGHFVSHGSPYSPIKNSPRLGSPRDQGQFLELMKKEFERVE